MSELVFGKYSLYIIITLFISLILFYLQVIAFSQEDKSSNTKKVALIPFYFIYYLIKRYDKKINKILIYTILVNILLLTFFIIKYLNYLNLFNTPVRY